MESGEVQTGEGEQFGFERLEVWQRAVRLASSIYGMTAQFPQEELFGLTAQFRRASVSVAANIAEGVSRSSGRDRARFYEIAYGSLNEIVTMLHIATDQGFVSGKQASASRSEIAEICRMLSSLRRSAVAKYGKSNGSTLNSPLSTANTKEQP